MITAFTIKTVSVLSSKHLVNYKRIELLDKVNTNCHLNVVFGLIVKHDIKYET